MENSLILAYFLIALGLLLMLSELVLITGGIAFGLGVVAIIVGLTMIFASGTSHGLVTLSALIVLIPLIGSVLIYYWPRTPMGKRLALPAAQDDATVANMPVNLELEQLRGKYGKALSSLRPAGITEFDGKRVDTMSEGPMIDPGAWVRCIDVKAGRVVVREVERPPDLADIDPNDLRS